MFPLFAHVRTYAKSGDMRTGRSQTCRNRYIAANAAAGSHVSTVPLAFICFVASTQELHADTADPAWRIKFLTAPSINAVVPHVSPVFPNAPVIRHPGKLPRARACIWA